MVLKQGGRYENRANRGPWIWKEMLEQSDEWVLVKLAHCDSKPVVLIKSLGFSVYMAQ